MEFSAAAHEESPLFRLGRNRQNLSDQPQDQASFGAGGALRREHHLEAGEYQENSEQDYDPTVLEQRCPEDDEGAPEDQCAQNSEEQYAVLRQCRDREITKHEDEHEDVVERKRPLDDISGKKLQADLL